jgi:flagellar protein FlaG
MALGAITGGVYSSEATGIPQKVKPETNYTQEQGAVNLNINETPAALTTAESNQSGNETGSGQKERTASDKQIKDAISMANNKMRDRMTRCEFAYHDDTKRITIKVIDRETEEVIREIPPDDTLKMLEKMWEMAGLLVDERR